jgi:hypothetical protein
VGAARATLTFEWSRKFEEPWQEGWGKFFSKAASKGLPRPFNAAGWRCSKCAEIWKENDFVKESLGKTSHS